MRALLITLALAGCGSDIKISSAAQCDGVLQGNEESVDSVFDADGDGFFDGANPDCQETYAAADLDCDDGDPTVNPGAAEVTCDGIDNDCSEDTPDSLDQDADLYSNCEECNDNDPDINPGMGEVACDEVDNDCNPDTPDGVDGDGDGWDECSDCDDTSIYLSPSLTEIPCNGLDDDCNEATPDSEDLDGDGASSCVDCDDDDGERSPELLEVCDDGIDNDCDDDIDEQCSYTGLYTLDTSVSYQCAWYYFFYLVDVNFAQIYIQDNGASVTISDYPGGSGQPGTTYGSFTSDTELSTTTTLTGSCNETYGFDGVFTDAETFEGVFSASYSGQCYDCASGSWSFTATLQ